MQTAMAILFSFAVFVGGPAATVLHFRSNKPEAKGLELVVKVCLAFFMGGLAMLIAQLIHYYRS
jgi:RsiW-degrading membrane proteinase PrsW (M82 family)